MKRICTVYRSKKKEGAYLIVDSKKDIEELLEDVKELKDRCYQLDQKERNTYFFLINYELDLLVNCMAKCRYRQSTLCHDKLIEWINKVERDKARILEISSETEDPEIIATYKVQKYIDELNKDLLIIDQSQKRDLVRKLNDIYYNKVTVDVINSLAKYNSTSNSIQDVNDIVNFKRKFFAKSFTQFLAARLSKRFLKQDDVVILFLE